MTVPRIEVYADIACPWTYLVVWRLRQLWPGYEGRVEVIWRALSLEYINERATPKPAHDAEVALIRRIEPELPLGEWKRPDWQWPSTVWPALEALACAQAQSAAAGFAMSWALRHAFFAESRCLALRHELFAIARSSGGALDLARFEADWDMGRHKGGVIEESRRGWHALKVNGSPTFVLPDGRRVSSPGLGEADIDEERGIVRSYTPSPGDPLAPLRDMLDLAAG